MSDDIPISVRRRHAPNKPSDKPYRQQQLKSIRFHLTITKVLPIAVLGGLILVGAGTALFFVSNNSLETSIDYTDCITENGTSAKDIINFSYPDGATKCVFEIELTDEYKGDVKFFYGLTGFYQNYRLYMLSRNDYQLLGDLNSTDECGPLSFELSGDGTSLPIVPCGFIANSFFNDTFKLYYHPADNDTETVRVPFSTNGIISNTEKKRKFKNPPYNRSYTLCDAFANTAKPPWWQKPICMLGVTDDEEDTSGAGVGLENVDLMVWMRTAALPSFRKYYRNLDRESDYFHNGLQKGNYTLVINYNYNPHTFNGKKMFVIARESWMGPRNLFLPIVCMVTGSFSILAFLGIFLCFTIRKKFTKV
ncbi:unnamed protein product [Auanema sp. JU1783]|nr:unnamed protein product [Auanema sp. JU1783]